MKTRLKIGWLVAGLAAVAVLLVAVGFAIGVSAGPDDPAPGPEEYHIYVISTTAARAFRRRQK